MGLGYAHPLLVFEVPTKFHWNILNRYEVISILLEVIELKNGIYLLTRMLPPSSILSLQPAPMSDFTFKKDKKKEEINRF